MHPRPNSACHRLFVAIEPGSYIRPHRHLDPEKDETMLIVLGTAGVLSFDDNGVVRSRAVLHAGECPAVDIAHGVYHTLVALEPGTVFFETKSGPYLPLSADEMGAFAPAEGSDDVPGYLAWMLGHFR